MSGLKVFKAEKSRIFKRKVNLGISCALKKFSNGIMAGSIIIYLWNGDKNKDTDKNKSNKKKTTQIKSIRKNQKNRNLKTTVLYKSF